MITSEPPRGGGEPVATDMLIDGLLNITGIPLLATLASKLLDMVPTAATTRASIACCSAALALGLISVKSATEESTLIKLPAVDVETFA